MRRFIVLSTLVLVLLAGCSADETLTKDEQVKNIVDNYLEAIETKNIAAAINYADDLRFPDKENQKEQYSILFSKQHITDTKIINLKKISETEFEATIELVENGNLATYTLPIKQKEKEWKLIVGQDSYHIERLEETDIELAKEQREKVLKDMKEHPELVQFAEPEIESP
ncbi:hypothetical protein LIT25_16225 [Bacillus sp. F19]|nr:hypothetical protein LIT25_16225 [Bacillus sp. F19]